MRAFLRILLLTALSLNIESGYCQTVTVFDFQQEPDIVTTKGVRGKAWDLGDVYPRLALQKPNPIRSSDQFTVLAWVKSDTSSRESYVILSETTCVNFPDKGWKYRIMKGKPRNAILYQGWKIGVQAGGAWYAEAASETFRYRYYPSAHRQSIRDGKWHMVGFSYDATGEEMCFYFDGKLMAIYQVPALQGMARAADLVIGNSADSEHDYKHKARDTFFGQIDEVALYPSVLTREKVAALYATSRSDASGPLSRNTEIAHKDFQSQLKITTFNIFHAGKERGREAGMQRTIRLLKKENADVYVLIETYGSGEEIADALGYELYLISSNLSIISRYPITATRKIFKPFNSGAAEIQISQGQKIRIAGVWLHHLPSYKAPLFKNDQVDVEALLKADQASRGKQAQAILADLDPWLKAADHIPVIIAGDFNSGSHLDWTARYADLHKGYVVPFNASRHMISAGLKDAFREIHTMDEAPGLTFSTWEGNQNYIRDRIDYIYFTGKKLRVSNSHVIGPVSDGFPSDHAGVTAGFTWK